MVAILGYSRKQIVDAVQGMYTAVASAPSSGFHFPIGRDACLELGYPREELDTLPEPLLQSFAGVGYPFHAGAISPGDVVLDVGAGAGNDSFIASRRVGTEGHVIALDLTAAMTAKLHRSITETGPDNISVVQASAERLPLANESVDAITSNGALNLVPDKRRAVREFIRVLRPGGRVQLADVVIRRPVTVDCHDDPRLWVECVVGATVDETLLELFRDAGFRDLRVVRTLDYFAFSPSAQTREVAASFGAKSIELGMRRGERAPSRAWQLLQRCNPRRMLAAMWRRGFLGMTSLILALLACYGMLAAVALLPLVGLSMVFHEGAWAATIVIFASITAAAIFPGIRTHGVYGPSLLAIAGAVTITATLFVRYNAAVELLGFLLLAAAVGWDIHLRRFEQSRVLGLLAARSQ